MATKETSRKQLSERWSDIDQQDAEDAPSSTHPIRRRRLRQLKEQWFSDAFTFLIHLPKENHVWCGYWDLMGPLLETFFNYFKEERNGSPLKLLWDRVSEEMKCCTLCIHQHHQAQEMYGTEYEKSCVNPLLHVLRILDEERVTQHLKGLNARIVRGEYDPAHDYGEVVSILFEVLMFPILLDDQSLATEFQIFIEAIDDSHELKLDGNQQYPGIYVLLFLKSRRARSIGLRLAGRMGKLRKSTDLDPLQHLLKKCIYILEAENTESAIETSRPRVQLDRITVWLGMKALVGFLEPAAFEEGILDRYPVFLSIVLNNISDDSLECSHAVNCMRLLFEKLGCKLWLRATLSPSVMRNTLLGQCFHTRNEKSHKEIFDLFQPFLQSLESLQDGEHEKQRRHFLYFLLHQVPVSSNFSILMKKKASQIAVLIVLRGYSMDPPSPPAECAHMWGPSIVSSLKDLSLHSSLRQPAIDLIQTVVVSDASAFLSVIMNGQFHSGDTLVIPNYCEDDGEDDGEEAILSALNINERDASCWKAFTLQHKIISQVDGSWMCAPMLWFDVFAEIDPSVLPLSFSKAVFWALSRFSLIEPENSTVMTLSLKNWLATCASEISYLFGWKVPSGCDDGADGTESKNSIRISTMCLPLLRTFKRLMTHYTVRMEQGQVRKQWTWEPMMSNSLILLLVDPNDSARQVARLILEQVSDVRGLTSGLQFLCSTPLSLSALLLGLRHALKLVQLDTVLLNFQTLHHLFFVLSKLLKEGNSSVPTASQNFSAVSKLSMEGGFLKQPLLDSSTTDCDEYPSILGSTLWKEFTRLLSQVAWPAILKCLDGSKTFIDHTASQMTCIRLLEVIPVVFERLPRKYGTTVETLDNLKWFHDLVDWGKSTLAILVRYWKQALASLLGLIKASCSSKSASVISNIEKLIFREKISTDEVSKQVAFLSIALLDDCRSVKDTGLKSEHSISEYSLNRRTCVVEDSENLIFDEAKASVLDSESLIQQERGHAIILSDDEEVEIEAQRQSSESTTRDDFGANAAGSVPCSDLKENYFSNHDSSVGSPDTCHQPSSSRTINVFTKKMSLEPMGGRQAPSSPAKLEPSDGKTKGKKISNSSLSQDNPNLKNLSDAFTNSKKFDLDTSKICSSNKVFSDLSLSSASKAQNGLIKSVETSDEVIKQVVCDTDDDTWHFSFFKPSKLQQALTTKPNASGPKRQVIQLALPGENKSGFRRPGGEVKRFNLPRLDDWYRPILKSDFFVDVGMTSGSEEDCKNSSILKRIPVFFQSPDEYVEIFRPLVLEELKAQLQNSFQEMSSTEEMSCGSLSVLSVERIDDFHVVRFVHDETDSTGSKTLLENDLILLTKQPLRNSSVDVHAVGKVERRDKESKRRLNIIAIRLYMQGCPRLNRARKLLTERSKWCVSRIMNITPQLREFQALSSIREIPLLPVILNPVNQPCCQYESRTGNFCKLSQPMQEIIKSSYNGSQLKAISVAIGPFDKDFELTLIQGPPGTGKTRTIVAIISGLLAVSQVKDAKRLSNYDQVCVSRSSTNQRISQSAAIARSWQDAALARQLNEEAEKNNKIMRSCSRGRILICAQSNAAVDELVARISCEGLYGRDGQMYKPYLVRVGNAKTVHPNSLPFFLDTLVENRLREEKGNKNEKQSGTSTDSLLITRASLEKLVDNIRYYEAKRASLQEGHSDSKNMVEGGYQDTVELSDAELKEELRKLYEKKKILYADLANIQARERKASDEIRTLRHKFRTAILKEAEIVVTTLSGCGGDLYGVCSESISGQNFNYSYESSLFDAVVIDEAAQALEPATLIPLQLLKSRGTKCIMVGDPKQLPATVISTVANKYLFQCSMFERLQRAGHPVIMLTQQYRMHPEICRFPSSHFYEGKLLNGEQMFGKAASFHETLCLGPYMLFDILDGRETRGKNAAALSICNECESDAAVEVFRYFKKRYPSEFLARNIGVITPYKCQLSLLRSRFSSAFGSSVTAEIEFNTIDGFQGREVDILLLSTVRAAGPSSETTGIGSTNLGFVADVRRMNVALTRAKLSLWIFGNARTLQTNPSWAALVEDATQRNLMVSGRKPYSSMFRSTLETRSNSGNLTSISGQLEQAESCRSVSGYLNTKKKIVKHSAERKRKYNDTVSDIACTLGEDVSHASKEADKNKKSRVIHGTNVPLQKVVATVAGKGGGKEVLKDAKSIVKENEESTDKTSDKQINVVKARDSANVRSRFTNSGKAGSRSQKQLKAVSDEMCVETIKHDKRQQKVKAGTSHSEISFMEQDEKAASDRVEILTDSFTKRKQQREAVDALLSSALVSSKKSGSMRKEYSKRTASTSKDNPVRPQKPRKG